MLRGWHHHLSTPHVLKLQIVPDMGTSPTCSWHTSVSYLFISPSSFSFNSSTGGPMLCVTHKLHFPHLLPPSGSGWRESWETKGDSPISPSPCRFGWGLVSCRCQSAIWSPLLADSCKATRVRATRTKWCWEERSAKTINHPQVFNFKNQLEESPFQVIEHLTSQMTKVKMRPLACFSTAHVSCLRGVKIALCRGVEREKKKTADCWICKTATRVTSR